MLGAPARSSAGWGWQEWGGWWIFCHRLLALFTRMVHAGGMGDDVWELRVGVSSRPEEVAPPWEVRSRPLLVADGRMTYVWPPELLVPDRFDSIEDVEAFLNG